MKETQELARDSEGDEEKETGDLMRVTRAWENERGKTKWWSKDQEKQMK